MSNCVKLSNYWIMEEMFMQWITNHKVKIIIGFLAISMAFSGSVLSASDVQDGITNPQVKVSTSKASAVVKDNKGDMAQVQAIGEINAYLAQMDGKDLAATLKLFRVAQVAKVGYVEDISTETIMTGGIKGAMNALGDPYSEYMDGKTYKDFMRMTKGSFGGVGLILGSKENVLTVVAPIEDTPGDKAGIKSGDQISKIDSKDTKDLTLEQAVNMIRGLEGSEVTLTINRTGEEMRDYTLIRSTIEIKTVKGKMLDNGIGYVRLSMFNEHTGDDFSKKIQDLAGEGMKGVILDLRNNPGGLLSESIKVANHFIPQGPVVSVVQKDGTKKTHFSDSETTKYPVVILVNGGSASASEIVAGAVQDTGVGTLIGTKTFGKGTVQITMPLGDDSAVKLTIAKYFTPNDRSIHGIGLEPDITVEMPDSKENTTDLQLEKAIEVLTQKL